MALSPSLFFLPALTRNFGRRIDNGLPLNEETEGSGQSNDGLYEAIVRVKIPKISLKSPTAINCVLTIPGTNYTKKRETIFYGKLVVVHVVLFVVVLGSSCTCRGVVTLLNWEEDFGRSLRIIKPSSQPYQKTPTILGPCERRREYTIVGTMLSICLHYSLTLKTKKKKKKYKTKVNSSSTCSLHRFHLFLLKV